MSTQYYEDDEDTEDEVTEPERSDADWAQLRREKKARAKVEKELNELKREKEFRKAGIDAEDPKFSYFVKGYEGEVTAEAIRAEALKAGFISEQPEPEPDQSGVEAQGRVAQAAGGGTDQPELAEAALQQAFDEGGVEGMTQFLASQGVPSRLVQ